MWGDKRVRRGYYAGESRDRWTKQRKQGKERRRSGLDRKRNRDVRHVRPECEFSRTAPPAFHVFALERTHAGSALPQRLLPRAIFSCMCWFWLTEFCAKRNSVRATTHWVWCLKPYSLKLYSAHVWTIVIPNSRSGSAQWRDKRESTCSSDEHLSRKALVTGIDSAMWMRGATWVWLEISGCKFGRSQRAGIALRANSGIPCFGTAVRSKLLENTVDLTSKAFPELCPSQYEDPFFRPPLHSLTRAGHEIPGNTEGIRWCWHMLSPFETYPFSYPKAPLVCFWRDTRTGTKING